MADRPLEIDPKAGNDVKIGVLKDNFESLWIKFQQLYNEKCCVQTTDDLPEGRQNLYYSDELVEVLIGSGVLPFVPAGTTPNKYLATDGVNTVVSVLTRLAPPRYDEMLPTAWGGSMGMEPTTIEYYFGGVVIETITITYNSDDEISTIANAGGDTWTATYDTIGRRSDWVLT